MAATAKPAAILVTRGLLMEVSLRDATARGVERCRRFHDTFAATAGSVRREG
jgi:hypothetical protein